MKKSILIVDDDNSIRQNYRDVLEDAGYFVVDYELADNWNSLINDEVFDLVLLDISINGNRHAGHAICKSLKSHYPKLPVIMLTSLDNEKNRAIAVENGADGYWVKSARLHEFLDDVQSILSGGTDQHA